MKKILLFLMFALFCIPWAANAQERIPYTEGFENMSSASDLTDAGWISFASSSDCFLAIETGASNVQTGSKALNIDSYSCSSSSEYQIVGLPVVDAAINTLQITFSYKVTNTTVAVGYLTDANDASTFVQLGSYSSASSYTTVTKELNEAPASAARIAIKYTGYYRCYIDDIEVKALPTCTKPTLGQAQFISEEGASFQWIENGSATNWVLEYSTDQNFTNATSINRSGIPSYAISGLTPGTLYYVHVKSNCGGGDESDWSNVVTFTTLCEPINAEGYSENFDSYTGTTSGSTNNLPDCWNHINTCSYSYYSGYPNVYSSNASSSPNCLRFYSYYSSWSDYDPQPQYAILPPMNSLAGMQVTLKAYGYNTTSTFKIGTMSDPSDASTFTMIAEQTGLTTSYQEFEYMVPADCRDKCLAIMIDAATTSTAIGVYIDDITITTPPTCIKPSGLEVTATTVTTATLSWTNGAEGQTAWQICLNDDESNLIDANSNPFTIDGEGVLSPASTYTAKVRANCGNGDYSDWSNTVTIETPCDVITVSESWSENFNSLTAGIPNCWDNSEGTTTTASHKWNYYATGHDGACLRFNSYSNTNNNTNFLKTPTLNFATGKVMQLSFWFKNPTGGDFSVYISTDGGTTYTTELATGLTGASNWTQQEINLPDYVDAENVVIVFKGTSNYGNGDAYIYLDDVAIAAAPSCLKPTGLAVDASTITSDGATITWIAGGEETQWQIEYATDAEFTTPSYVTVTADPDAEAYVPTYTFQGLDDATTYYVHVQAVCGGSNGSSEYSTSENFTTLQTPANLPYSTDFENGNDWLFVNGNLTNAWAYGEATNNGGTHAIYVSNDGGVTNAYTQSSAAMVYATKVFNFEAGTYVFSYDWNGNGESTYDYMRVALVPSSVQLAAATSVPSGFSTSGLPTGWIALDGGSKLNLKTEWQSFASNEIEVSAGTYMMVFAWRDDTSGGSNPPAAVDNVSIEMVTCVTPTDLAVNESATTATSVELSWTETGEATAWQIELTDAEDNVQVIDADRNPFTLNDLDPESIYAARVRAYCDEESQSRWSEETIFETAEECQTPNGLEASEVTTNSAVISWNGYGQETFNLNYSTDGETWTTVREVANNYQLADLESATTYYVQVQPTCADEETWSESYSFTTECDDITVAEGSAYTYDFEDEMPWVCWTNVAGSNVRSSGSNNTTGGNYKLQFKGTTTGNIVAMPAFTPDINGLKLTFWTRPEGYNYSSCGTFSVGYMTDLDDASTFVAVDNYDRSEWTSNTYIEKNVTFTNAPAGAYIAFCHNALATNYYWYVDDVTVELAPSCKILVNADNPTWNEDFEGYDITTTEPERWTGVLPDCWTVPVQYTGTTDTLPQIYHNFNTTDNGEYSLRMHFRYMLAMPELDENVDLGKIRLNMNVRQPYYAYKLQIGVITDMDNPETSFVPVAVVNNSGKNMTNFECGFASVSNLVGAGRHIAFKNIGGSSNDLYCTNYMDDVTLTYVDVDDLECEIYPDYTEDFEAYAVGAEPNCWEVITEDVALESTTRPQVYAGYNTTTPSGSKSLRMKNRCVYAMPEFLDYPISRFTMYFQLRQPKSIYRLQVGLVDEEGNFTALKTFKCNGTNPQEMELNFAEFDCSVGSRIAFRNTLVPGTGKRTDYLDYSINYIDDIYFAYEAKGRSESNADAFDAEGSLEDIAVYPNPTTGNLYIDAIGIQKVECYNQMGQLVRVYDNVRNNIDLNNLSEGVYTLRITVPQGVTVRKVVKR